ncbi:hypothetical protein CVV43_05385 [Candidatus Saccharibacteria bacterium HGW-Saccharibacteria-1]|jgi:hypothetical protein|nr:MAG: hypothetical protein CVV43_05385 [Candidatus Saccharibacteria bacterium HGW-Saccharibacteria-1]
MAFEQRLPNVNGDDGQWGDVLNQFISKEHYNSGLHDTTNGCHKSITILPGSTNAGTAPLKFTSGPLLSSPESGALEFNNDNLYLTQTTNSTRKKVATFDDSVGATGDIYYRDNSGNLVRIPAGSTNQILTITDGVPSWSTVVDGAKRITISNTQPATPTVGDLWIDSN